MSLREDLKASKKKPMTPEQTARAARATDVGMKIIHAHLDILKDTKETTDRERWCELSASLVNTIVSAVDAMPASDAAAFTTMLDGLMKSLVMAKAMKFIENKVEPGIMTSTDPAMIAAINAYREFMMLPPAAAEPKPE